MTRRRRALFAGIVVLGIAAAFLLTRGPEAPSPNPPGTFSFAALGDAPYHPWEEIQYPSVLRDIDAHDLSFVVHVGDIFWRPCTDEHYRVVLGRFNGLRHPVIYTPGDNEWRDCWEPRSGGFEPRERLQRVRRIFFADPARSLGGRRLPLVSQAGRRGPFAGFVENARWVHQGIAFATVHVVGAVRDRSPWAQADDMRRRMDAASAWVRETFAEARAADASAVVLAFQANPDFEDPVDAPFRRTFDPFILAVEEEAERFRRPVLLAHGDGHDYTVDHPLVRRTTGRRLKNITRLQVPGSPAVGWVRVVVAPGAASPFTFEKRVVPRWKYW